jgi:hypothetical protein
LEATVVAVRRSAWSDPATFAVRVLAVALCAAVVAGCAGAPTEPARDPLPQGSSEAPGGVQSTDDLADGAEDRVEPALIAANAVLPGVAPVALDVVYQDDVASAVCGNRSGPGVYGSMFGQRRRWAGNGLEVEQFAGVFGSVTASEAIAQVSGVLRCGSYRDRDGEHTEIHEVTLPSLPKIDGSLMFCETLNGATHVCTVLLAREDMLSRVEVTSKDEAAAKKAA